MLFEEEEVMYTLILNWITGFILINDLKPLERGKDDSQVQEERSNKFQSLMKI